jgi:hypothetical protein
MYINTGFTKVIMPSGGYGFSDAALQYGIVSGIWSDGKFVSDGPAQMFGISPQETETMLSKMPQAGLPMAADSMDAILIHHKEVHGIPGTIDLVDPQPSP